MICCPTFRFIVSLGERLPASSWVSVGLVERHHASIL
jgi:hypothetical protein